MAAGYTKEFLVDALVSRFTELGPAIVEKQRVLADQLYDKVGKDSFRAYASLDAAALKVYKDSKK